MFSSFYQTFWLWDNDNVKTILEFNIEIELMIENIMIEIKLIIRAKFEWKIYFMILYY